MISIICCYNDKSVFEKMLKRSIENQNIECELIGINNFNNQFSSAASALNYGATLAKGDYYFFAHQDIEFNDRNFVRELVNYIEHSNPSIVGLAGKKNSEGVYTNIKHVDKDRYAGDFRIDEPIEVQTLDECLIAMKKEVFDKLHFNEITCDNWHLYSVDLCLSAKKEKIKVIAVPLEAFHASSGVVNIGYWRSLDKVVKHHRKYYKEIYTTCSNVKTGYLEYFYFRLMINIKQYIKNLYKTVKI